MSKLTVGSVMRDLADGMPVERALDRETLRAAVQTAIFCPKTGVVLDVSTAVLWTIRKEGVAIGANVMHADAWDPIVARLLEQADEAGLAVEILDGRQLFAK